MNQELDSFVDQLLGTEKFRPGLDRLRPLFGPLNQFFKNNGVKAIIVAGTNGKGETAMCLARLLEQQGKSVGLWTSPHIASVTERFHFFGQTLSEECLLKYFRHHEKIVGQLSYYEFLFYCFCQIAIESEGIDTLVLEVGLGGRLDTVNLIDPSMTVLTSISRDHQEYLGNSYRQILHEKLGITRRGIPLIVGTQLSYINHKIDNYCDGRGIPTFYVRQGEQNYSRLNQSVAEKTASLILKNEVRLCHPIHLPGRFEKVTKGDKHFILIGAHNSDGLRAMFARLREKERGPLEFWIGFSSRDFRDLQLMLKIVDHYMTEGDFLLLGEFNHPRSINNEILRKLVESLSEGQRKRVRILDNWQSARKHIDGPQTIIVTGSYFFIGEMAKHIHFAYHDSNNHSQ